MTTILTIFFTQASVSSPSEGSDSSDVTKHLFHSGSCFLFEFSLETTPQIFHTASNWLTLGISKTFLYISRCGSILTTYPETPPWSNCKTSYILEEEGFTWTSNNSLTIWGLLNPSLYKYTWNVLYLTYILENSSSRNPHIIINVIKQPQNMNAPCNEWNVSICSTEMNI